MTLSLTHFSTPSLTQSFVRFLLLPAMLIVACTRPAFAEPERARVVVLTADADAAMVSRLVAELAAHGYDSTVVVTASPTEAAVEEASERHHAAAAVVVGDGAGTAIWARDGSRALTRLDNIAPPADEADAEGVVAVRIAELLRARSLEVAPRSEPAGEPGEPAVAAIETAADDEAEVVPASTSRPRVGPEFGAAAEWLPESERPWAPADEPMDEAGPDSHSFAMLFNVAGHVLSPVLLDVAVVEPEFQFLFNDYLALDLMPGFAHFYGDSGVTASGGGGQLGIRILPMGEGLDGLYLVPRVGALYARGKSRNDSIETTQITPTFEVGWGGHFSHFVMNFGVGAGYAFTVGGTDVYEDAELGRFQLMGNLSLGFGL
jgi:hypothetical protein